MKLNAITSDYALSALLQVASRATDGGGLFVIRGKRNDNHYWRFSYTFKGIRKTLSLGVFPRTTLKQARNLAEEFRAMVAAGTNPSDWRKTLRQKSSDLRKAENLLKGSAPAKYSFKAIALEWFEVRRSEWSIQYSSMVMGRMKNHLFPSLGTRHIAAIGPSSISRLCREIQKKGSVETGIRVFKLCKRICAYAISEEYLERNWCSEVDEAFESPTVRHFPAITEPSKLSILLRHILEYSGTEVVKAALTLKPMLLVRGIELRKAEWCEFDLNLGEWRVPAVRMKGRLKRKISGLHHIVPLPTQAIVVLQRLYKMNMEKRSKYVFPALRKPQTCMSGNTLNKALRAMGYSTEFQVTAHGFRATARTMIVERLGLNKDYAELQLAHSVRDQNGAAYNRVQHLPERKQMLQAWADYLDDLRDGRFQSKRDLDAFKPITETGDEGYGQAVAERIEASELTVAEQIYLLSKQGAQCARSTLPGRLPHAEASRFEQNGSYQL